MGSNKSRPSPLSSKATPSIYQPLHPSQTEIRLCSISAGEWHAPLELTLETARLDDQPGYTALSYVWGSQQNRPNILLGGTWTPVTQNLYNVLQQLRADGVHTHLWVDALCIDQSSEEEKAHQVALMGRIFQEAEHVVVWLGRPGGTNLGSQETSAGAVEDGDDDTGAAIYVLEALATGAHFHELPCFSRCAASVCPSSRTARTFSWRAVLRGLEVLMDAAWFVRTWTVQEIVLAKDATLMYGAHRIPWETVMDAWGLWSVHLNRCCGACIFSLPAREFQLLHRVAGRVVDLVNARQRLPKSQSLLQVLLKFKTRQTSDPRDRIYGLLGLQSSSERLGLQPDYTLTLAATFIRFASELIRAQGWPVPLHLDLTQRTPALPSWVPDWTYSSADPSDYAVARYEALTTYNASAGLTGPPAIAKGPMLEVHGARIDTIAQVSRPYRLTPTPGEQLHLIASWHDFLALPTEGQTSYITGGTREQAFFHTVFGDRYHDDRDIRKLKPDDIVAWRTQLADTARRLRELGPRAPGDLHPGMSSHVIAVLRRRIFVSTEGYLGLCPEAAAVGDEVVILCGSPTPVFLRRGKSVAHGRSNVALGDGYIHGLMDGEAAALERPVEGFCIH